MPPQSPPPSNPHPGSADPGEVLFFVHIQKTAGGTLRQFIRSKVPPGGVYPDNIDDQALACYWEMERLRAITPERRRQIRAYIGHFPYIASQLIDVQPVTVSVLRHPVERTISYLKMRSRDPERAGLGLEEIYDHPFDFPSFIHNHQTKIFAMTLDDKLETFMDHITIDDDRLAIAKENLGRIDILGLQERSGEVLEAVATRFDWAVDAVEDTHVSRGEWDIPEGLRDRIAEDNAADMELYRHAESLYLERRTP